MEDYAFDGYVTADAWAGESIYNEEMAAMIELTKSVGDKDSRLQLIKDAVRKIQHERT